MAEEGMGIRELIYIILGIIILVGVILVATQPWILDWIKQLPSYQSSGDKDKEIDASTLTDSQREELCPVKVARGVQGEIIKKCRETKSCQDNSLSDTKLLWKGSYSSGNIEVDQWVNDAIGDIQGGRIRIYPEVFEGKGVYAKVAGDLPDYEFVANLNGAYYGFGNFMCRKEKISVEENRKSLTFENPILVDFGFWSPENAYRYSAYSKSWEFNVAGFGRLGWRVVSESKSKSHRELAKSLIGKNEREGILEFSKFKGASIKNMPRLENE